MMGSLTTAALILAITGSLLASLCAMVLRWNAFRKSVGWGLACIFLPLADFVFVVRFWRSARILFLAQLGGTIVMLAGFGVMMRDTGFRTSIQDTLNSKVLQAKDEAEVDAAFVFTPPAHPPVPASSLKNNTRQLQETLQRWYDDLQKRRPGSEASADQVRAYNAECADYQALQKQYQSALKSDSKP